ncbi:hypothetical protein OSTOST_21904, partial [Ostertagia ostertagi]
HPDYANVIETKASLVRLRGLDSGTAFRIKVKSVYNDVQSTEAIESIFRTSGTPEYDYDNSAESFSIRTLPPGFDLATTTTTAAVSGSDYLYSTEDLEENEPSTNPQAVEGVRIVSSETDEFYVSRISIDWDWPSHNNFDLYQIVISYGLNEASLTEIEVTEAVQKPLVLDKLEPTHRYRIHVRNESLELGLSSMVVQLEQIT